MCRRGGVFVVSEPVKVSGLRASAEGEIDCGSLAALRKAGRRKLVEVIRPKAPGMATRLIGDVFRALEEQTVVVPGAAPGTSSCRRWPSRCPTPDLL